MANRLFEIVGTLAPKFSADVQSEITGTVRAVYVTEWVPVRVGTDGALALGLMHQWIVHGGLDEDYIARHAC